MSYQTLRYAAILVTILVGAIGVIQAADPVSLGFSPLAARWLGVGSGILGVVLGFLPRIQEQARRVTDPGPPAETDAMPTPP